MNSDLINYKTAMLFDTGTGESFHTEDDLLLLWRTLGPVYLAIRKKPGPCYFEQKYGKPETVTA